MTTATKPLTVRVLRRHIRQGIGGDCWGCALARALQEATGDKGANVFRRDYILRVEVWSRSVVASLRVAWFVNAFDDLDLRKDGRVKVPRVLPETLQPFSFELPALDSPEWVEKCYGCEELCDPKTLDAEGYCPDCRPEGSADA